jgi:hypothetical protein
LKPDNIFVTDVHEGDGGEPEEVVAEEPKVEEPSGVNFINILCL